MKFALLCVDLVKDMVDENGKLAGEGFAEFAKKHEVLNRIGRIQDQFRQQNGMVVHARTQFSSDYFELAGNNKLLSHAKSAGALQRRTEGTEFVDQAKPLENEPVVTKHRVSPFFHTRLDLILSSQEITDLYIVGAGTSLAVESAAREAHDRDFNVHIISDGCIGRSEESHEASLKHMSDFAQVKTFGDLAAQLLVA